MRHLPTALVLLVIVSCCVAEDRFAAVAIERVATGFRFTEGPALGPDGAIYFSDLRDRKVHRYDPQTGETSVAIEDSGGSNGLAWRGNDLILCEDRDRRVSRCRAVLDETGKVIGFGEAIVLAETFGGKRLNSPNDLVVHDDGGITFTDPRYGKRETMELDVEAVYHLSPQGELRQIATDLKRPNGVALSPEGNLYIADNGAGEIVVSTRLGEPTPFAVPPAGTKGGPDGMTVDAAGNLFAAWHGDAAVHVWSPGGEHLGRIRLPGSAQPTNVEFADEQTLYITAGDSLYRATLP